MLMGKLVGELTGTFGSRKSTVGRIFKQLGAIKVIDCDRLVHEALRPGHPICKRVQSLLGKPVRLARKAIAREVFLNPSKRKELEAIVHPYVFERIAVEL